MISGKMKPLVENNSVIRVMFEEGKRLAAIYGAENVYDFSLGNPNVPAPPEVEQAILDTLREEESTFLHGYMSNAGYEDVRETIAQALNSRFGTRFSQKNILMTVGAASGLNVILKTILNPGDEVIVFAPYFVEYGNYVRNYDGQLTVISPNTADFQPNLEEFAEKITGRTKAVIINTPNNPTGVVYSHETLTRLAEIMRQKTKELGTEMVLISDEPYRELVYDGNQEDFLTKYYRNTIVGYSFSKSLSLPGERIGYVVVPDEVENADQVIDGIVVSNRTLGFVNAPSLLQKAVAKCLDEKTNLAFYDENRKMLYEGLQKLGFHCIKPEGAFYMWVKSPDTDEEKFVAAGKKYNIIMVKGSAFGCAGYVRLAYCVSHETVKNALTAFEKLAEDYGLYTE